MKQLGRRLLFGAMVAVLIVLSACGGTPTPSPKPKPTPPPPLVLPSVSPLPTGKAAIKPESPEGTPSIRFEQPLEGQKLPTSLLGIAATAINFNWQINSWKGENLKNCGFMYFYLDVDPPTEAGKSTLTAKGTYAKADQLGQNRFTGLKAGKHFLWAQLVNYDSTPLVPPVTLKVNFETVIEAVDLPPIVHPGPASVTILTPTEGSTSNSTIIEVKLDVKNFTYLADPPVADRDGQGKIACYLDNVPPAVSGKSAAGTKGLYKLGNMDTFVWTNVAPGTHTIYVQLTSNTSLVLKTPITVKVTFTVAPTATPAIATGGGGD